MARTIDIQSVDIQIGNEQAFEVDSPTRANGCIITLARLAPGWPGGPLFTYRIYERERNGVLQLLTSASESGGPAPRRDGLPGDAPLVIQLTWKLDRDRDRIRFEADVVQPFTCGVKIDWID